MRDTLRLQRRFALELLVVPLLACGKHPPPPAAADAAPITTTTADPEPTSAPTPQPTPIRRPPSCPSGTWCTTPSNAAKIANGAETTMGCAASITWSRYQGDSGATDLPMSFGQGSLDVSETTDAGRAKAAAKCCYSWSSPCPGGRPLRGDSGARTAPLGEGVGWCADVDPSPSDLASEVREALANAWLADALAEHASVASFARASLELMAVGAPADLVAACQRASLDEIEHARGCFAQAARFAGRREGPAPFVAPACRAPTLEQVAVDTFIEGCVGETIAALAAERARSGCSDASAREVLARIAEDEAAHAALAWRTVAWAAGAAPSLVLRALDAAARDARAAVVTETRVDAIDARTLARFGRLTADEQHRVVADAWRDVIDPTLEALNLGARQASAPNASTSMLATRCAARSSSG